MRKYIVGMIFGILLSLSTSVYAEEIKTLIGRAIEGEFPVHINGKTLSNKAIVIDGTSYLPVREFGEAVGYDVKFDADLGISLEKKLTGTGEKMSGEYKAPEWAGMVIVEPPTEPPAITPIEIESEPTLEEIDQRITSIKSQLKQQEWILELLKDQNADAEKIKQITKIIEEYNSLISELEAKKAELSK